MQPSTKWIVEFADSSCIMARRFGSTDKPVDLHIKAPMLGQLFEVVIVVPETGSLSGNLHYEGWIERPDGTKAASISAGGYSTISKAHLTRFYVDPEKYLIGQDGERLIVHLNKRRRYDFALPDLKKAQAVLDQCVTGLRDEFGVGEKVTRQIATPAKQQLSIVRYFSTDDYPSEAVAKGEQGYVGALFWVETDGRVKECKVIESSHRKLLDERTCEVIRMRARYSPALDAQGKPIRSPHYQRIRWEMPG